MTLARLLASGLGTGFSPRAPGTAGSLLGLVLGGTLLAASPTCLALGTLAVTVLGLWASARAAALPLRARGLGDHADPQWVVIDEVAGQMLTLLALPRVSIAGLALAFGLFRVLDIVKPGPIGWADRRGGALGIMLDDVLAGGLAAALLWGLRATGGLP